MLTLFLFLALCPCSIAQMSPKAIIVTSLPEAPCTIATGSQVNLMALRNKQDYADLHGYKLHWTRTAQLQGPWNKVAVMLQLLQQYSSTAADPPWLIWLDADSLVANMSRTVPFARYAGKDIVIPGDQRALDEVDAQGINTGVMLVRATPRALLFFQDLAALARQLQSNTSTTTKMVRTAVQRYHDGLYDQNAVVYLLHTSPSHRAAVAMEPVGDYGLHSHFVANLPLPMIAVWGLPLVVHYAGCAWCPSGPRVALYGLHACVKHFAVVHNIAADMGNAMRGVDAAPMPVQELLWRLEAVDPVLDQEFKL